MTMHARAVDYLRGLQDRICAGLATADGGSAFREDTWTRPGGVGGRSRVVENGAVFEKGGANFSEGSGAFPAQCAKYRPGEAAKSAGSGVPLVIPPRSPLVPAVRANFRFLTHGS